MKIMFLCLFLAGCSAGIQPMPYDAGPAPDSATGDGAIPCPATWEECQTILFCPALCRYDAGLEPDAGQADAGAGEDAGAGDAGADAELPPADAGTDAGCNPGTHSDACFSATSCVGADRICRPCCT